MQRFREKKAQKRTAAPVKEAAVQGFTQEKSKWRTLRPFEAQPFGVRNGHDLDFLPDL